LCEFWHGTGISGQITLLQSWTDRGEPPLGRRLSAEGLAVLDTLARSLRNYRKYFASFLLHV
jgi:hypothetical protein